MNCAWCGRNADGSDSHGICQECSDNLKAQSAWRQLNKVESYVERNAREMVTECDQYLSEQMEVVA